MPLCSNATWGFHLTTTGNPNIYPHRKTYFSGTIDHYRQLVGNLRYFAGSTRSYFSSVTGEIGCATHSPTTRQLLGMKSVLRYLLHTPNRGMTFKTSLKRPPSMDLLQAYTDESFWSDHNNRKPKTGVVITYNNAPIYYASKKKLLMAISTPESEYIVVATDAQQYQAIRSMCTDTNLMAIAPCFLKTYNQAYLLILDNPYGTKRRQYIYLRHHLISHLIKHNNLKIIHIHIPGESQKANMLTKHLQRVFFERQGKALQTRQ